MTFIYLITFHCISLHIHRSYVTATFIGFAPGTFGIVYAGSAGKDLFDNDGVGLPWYVYGVGFALILVIANAVGKIAVTAIEEIQKEEGNASNDEKKQ